MNSLFKQDIPESEYEIICVDDCSTDKTCKIIQQCQKAHPSLRLLHLNENSGCGVARKKGLESAGGNYIWFIDPDDYILENVMSELLKRAENNRLDIALFNCKRTEEETGEVEDVKKVYQDSEVCDGYTFLDKYCNKRIGDHSIVWLQLYSREFLTQNHIQYPSLRISSDALFSWEALFKAKRVQSESKARYIYRANRNSVTANIYSPRKIFVTSIESAYEICELRKRIHIRSDYNDKLYLAACSDMEDLFKRYKYLSLNQRKELWKLLRGSEKLKYVYKLVGMKKRIVLLSRYASFLVFNMLMKSIK